MTQCPPNSLNEVFLHDLDEYAFARLAVDVAKLSPADSSPRVGVVLADGPRLVGWSAKGYGGTFRDRHGTLQILAGGSPRHAEEMLLDPFADVDLSKCSLFVTLEPCTRRKSLRKTSCADKIISQKIRTVFIGNSDPNPDVGALAWRRFFAAGIAVRDFPCELRNEARRDNAAFFAKFVASTGEAGRGAFDYTQNHGLRTLGNPGREFHTKWGPRGDGSIYAYDYDHNVALAKGCTSFAQVDDPGRWFEDQNYYQTALVGDIIIFRNDFGYALVRVIEALKAIPELGRNAELKFEYSIRYF